MRWLGLERLGDMMRWIKRAEQRIQVGDHGWSEPVAVKDDGSTGKPEFAVK